MAYVRVNVRNTDKQNKPKAYVRYYAEVDKVLALYRIRGGEFENPAIDVRFFVREIAANFLEHDGHFSFAHIGLKIDEESLDVAIDVTHNGKDFDPLDADSTCTLIKAAAKRMTTVAMPWRTEAGLSPKFELKFNLKNWTNLGETHVL